ncbi:hypothetical protein FGIG_09523 [Fasciola gigantica]|uniref:RING-type domain-containing protein n=1 Tax=Fasciola gigantica TaxID=46835 RepID=A0A504YI69_FASGI|nr:hypothetical protein FGIG_09523 [Fasciola gigantica]
MGYPTERFSDPVDENLICGICCGVFIYPVVTNCGHTFCHACLDEWLQKRNSEITAVLPTGNESETRLRSTNLRCPACRQLLDASVHPSESATLVAHSGSLSLARPVLALRNLIGSLPMKCAYASRGCTVVNSVEFMESENHKSSCACAPVKCEGCGVEVNRSELATHRQFCTGNEMTTTKSTSNKSTQTEKLICKHADQFRCTGSTNPIEGSREQLTADSHDLWDQDDCFPDHHSQSSLSVFMQCREQETMQFLNLSLMQLVHELKFELECSQTELRMAKMQVRSSNGSHSKNAAKNNWRT